MGGCVHIRYIIMYVSYTYMYMFMFTVIYIYVVTLDLYLLICRRVFWITGNNIMTKYLNSLEPMTCCSLESEPLALTVDTDNQYLYWMTFDTVDNTVSLSQLNYTTKECGTR